jgi:hypothetical protein
MVHDSLPIVGISLTPINANGDYSMSKKEFVYQTRRRKIRKETIAVIGQGMVDLQWQLIWR